MQEKTTEFKSDAKICFLTELFCYKLGIDVFQEQKDIYILSGIIFRQFNFTSPIKAIVAVAIYVYSTFLNKGACKKKVSLNLLTSVTGSSKSCIKRLRKKYEANKDMYLEHYNKEQKKG